MASTGVFGFRLLFSLIGRIWSVLLRFIGRVRSEMLTLKVNASSKSIGKISITNPFLPIRIELGKGAKFILRGELKCNSQLGFHSPILILLGENSTLEIDGDFQIGSGCKIYIYAGAKLYIGGRRIESGAGITENTLIMVRKNLRIGTDLLCAWGCFITDCDWHDVVGRPFQADTDIGNHVWIAPNCSILKGTHIGNGCLVATGSIAHKAVLPDNTLGGGVPFRVLSTNREWHRDMPPLEDFPKQ